MNNNVVGVLSIFNFLFASYIGERLQAVSGNALDCLAIKAGPELRQQKSLQKGILYCWSQPADIASHLHPTGRSFLRDNLLTIFEFRVEGSKGMDAIDVAIRLVRHSTKTVYTDSVSVLLHSKQAD